LHQCSFCNQTHITGIKKQPTPKDVICAVKTAVAHEDYGKMRLELAFFGGSFTALNRDYMISLLKAAQPFISKGVIKGIRISTRPDAIDRQILSILKTYGVSAIELGAQSMIDEVLKANRRGHTAQQVKDASALIKQAGFELGLQMMTGLYTDTAEGAKLTAQKIAECKPDTVRIYPTVIMSQTHLGELFQRGDYQTFSLEKTVDLCSELLHFFEDRQIQVIRLGLHSTPELEKERLSGPWHPALRELCESRNFRNSICNELQKNHAVNKKCLLFINGKDRSKIVGHKKSNLEFFSSQGYNIQVIVDESIEKNSFKIAFADKE